MDYKNILVGIGNPLLDITANVDKQFVQNHRLEENGSMLVTKKYMDELIDEILNSQSDPNIEYTPGGTILNTYTPGGTILNTVRIFQWAMNRIVNNDNKPITHFATFFGATGNDDYSEILLSESQKSGLRMLCQKIEDEHTGRCLTMINGTKRSMCADLGAASKFNLEFLETPENWSVIENATAHFLNVSPNCIMRICEYAANKNKKFIFNMGAIYLAKKFKKEIEIILKYSNLIFGTPIYDFLELSIHAPKLVENSFISRHRKLLYPCLEVNGLNERVVVITRDALPLIVIKNDGQMIEYKVKEIPNVALVDSSCAGDAFAGGFIAAYVCGYSLKECIEWGCSAAEMIIQRRGCKLD
uniref:Adenosine kinase n=1 Tax=Meloidogyne floridensis TaxID=298350 RepID=A0A915NH10_9BILA